MSLFKVSVVARNTKDESLVSPPVEAMVDSGSELTWLPRDVLLGIPGHAPTQTQLFDCDAATGQSRDGIRDLVGGGL